MEVISGCSALLRVLEDEGVDYIFGHPGTTELPIMDALVDRPGLKYILGLQESVAMAMADGYSRASGRLSCANFHVAPGLGNAIGAIYNAKFFGSPVIVTAGQQERGFSLTEPMLYSELVPMARPVVKWATEVQRAEDVPRVLRRAAKIAMTPPTGPVFVSLPADLLRDSGKMELGAPTRVDSRSLPRQDTLERLADRLLTSKDPLIISCHEVYTSDAFSELVSVAELLGAPVYIQSVPCVAVFPTEHPHYMGEITRNQRRVREVLDRHDLLFMVGGDGLRMSLSSPVEPMPPDMPIIQVGTGDWEIGKNYPAEIALDADVKETLSALMPILEKKRTSDYEASACRRAESLRLKNWSANRKTLLARTETQESEKPIQPDYLMMQIAAELPEAGVVVEEGISSTRNLLNFLTVKNRQRFYGLASGGIGCGIAAAVGIKLALPGRPLVAVIGDGSAMYSIQALWSAANQNLQVTFVIANNSGYSILKERLLAFGGLAATSGKRIGMDFNSPSIDFVQLASALGVPGMRITNPEQVGPAIRKALGENGPFLLDVHVRDISKE
jgi:benzoylformate decarboxylase